MTPKNLTQKLFFAVILTIIAGAVNAQDIINKCNGDEIKVIVLEVGNYEVTYKLFDHPDGENKILKRKLIDNIVYANGERERLYCQELTEIKQDEMPEQAKQQEEWKQEEQWEQEEVREQEEQWEETFTTANPPPVQEPQKPEAQKEPEVDFENIRPEQPKVENLPVETAPQPEYQHTQSNQEKKYRRSSLSLILLDSSTSTDEILEINTLKECENILMDEFNKRNIGNIEQLKQEIDNNLWAKESNLNVGTIKKIAKDSWNSYPFPDKYDNQEIKTKRINLIDELIKLSKKDEKEIQIIETKITQLTQGRKSPINKLEAGRLKAIVKIAQKDKTPDKYAGDLKKIDKKYGNGLKTYRLQVEEYNDQIADIKVGGVRSTIFTAMRDQKKDTKIIQPKIEKQLKEQGIAQQLVREWFSSEDGKMFDMSTIQKRGLYDANMLDFNIAKSNVRGLAMLADAGEELINNTFVTVIDLDFFSNKPIADRLRSAGKAVAQAAGNAGTIGAIIGATAQLSTSIAAAAIEDGYTVFSKTFLYKLKWNDEIANKFYSIWGDENAFDKMDFQMEFVGVQYEKSVINAGIFNNKENREMGTVVKKLVTRNLDNNFANLQKEYDVFKTKVPIKSINPITADIGKKEGLQGGEKFEILEMIQNPETGRTKWNRVGTATVDKKLVWDNRYNAGEEPENIIIGADGNPITATTFKSVNNAQVGMFLRQVK